MKKDLGKTGSAVIKKVGHTYSGRHGSEPMAKMRGSSEPTPQNFTS